MAQIVLASSPRCGHCRDFQPKWDGVISALGSNYERYFSKPPIDEWADEVDAVPQLIVWFFLFMHATVDFSTHHITAQIRDTSGERMTDLEDDMLSGWRSASNPIDAIEGIKTSIDTYTSYEDDDKADIVDLLTHLDLYKPRASRFETIPEVNNSTNKYEPDRRFYLDNTLENQYMVGDSISFYGSDAIGSLNI